MPLVGYVSRDSSQLFFVPPTWFSSKLRLWVHHLHLHQHLITWALISRDSDRNLQHVIQLTMSRQHGTPLQGSNGRGGA